MRHRGAGIVASLNRQGANVTGVNQISTALVPKQLDLLHQLVPRAATINTLVNPNYPDVDLQLRELHEAATVIERKIHVVRAGAEHEIDAAFVTLVKKETDTLLVANDPFFEGIRRPALRVREMRDRHPAQVLSHPERRERRNVDRK